MEGKANETNKEDNRSGSYECVFECFAACRLRKAGK